MAFYFFLSAAIYSSSRDRGRALKEWREEISPRALKNKTFNLSIAARATDRRNKEKKKFKRF